MDEKITNDLCIYSPKYYMKELPGNVLIVFYFLKMSIKFLPQRRYAGQKWTSDYIPEGLIYP